MSIISKITFYPKIALRYLYELLIRGLKFLLNFLTNIGLMIIGVLITISILSYNKFDPSLNTSSDDLSNNLISYPGSYAADLLMQTFGFASILISVGIIIEIKLGLPPNAKSSIDRILVGIITDFKFEH